MVNQKKHPDPLTLALLAAIVLLGGWLRVRQASDSLWLDELHTAWVAEGGSQLAERAAMGNQSPLYFYGVAAVNRLLGPSEFSIRLLSLIAGSLLPLAVWGLARRLIFWDGRAGGLTFVPLVAAWLVAVNRLAVFYSQEARPYAWVQLLAVVQVGLLVEWLQRPSRWTQVAWIACGALLFYLHYTAALVIVAEVVFVLGWLVYGYCRSGVLDRPAFTRLAVAVLSLLLLALPAVPTLGEIYERRQNWALFVQRVGLAEIAELPRMIPWSAAALIFGLAYLVASATSYSPSLRERARVRERGLADGLSPQEATQCAGYFASAQVPSVWLLLCWLIVPVAIAAITSAADWLRLWHVRYLIGVTPAAFLLAAMLPRLVPQRIAPMVAIGLALYAGWSSHRSLDWFDLHGRPQHSENWRAAADFLNAHTDRHPILLRSGLIEADALRTSSDEQLTDYCRFPLTALYRLKRPAGDIRPLTMTDAGRLTESLRRELQPEPGETNVVWLVVRGNDARADQIVRELQQTFAPHATAVSMADQCSFGGVQLRRLELAARSRRANR